MLAVVLPRDRRSLLASVAHAHVFSMRRAACYFEPYARASIPRCPLPRSAIFRRTSSTRQQRFSSSIAAVSSSSSAENDGNEQPIECKPSNQPHVTKPTRPRLYTVMEATRSTKSLFESRLLHAKEFTESLEDKLVQIMWLLYRNYRSTQHLNLYPKHYPEIPSQTPESSDSNIQMQRDSEWTPQLVDIPQTLTRSASRADRLKRQTVLLWMNFLQLARKIMLLPRIHELTSSPLPLPRPEADLNRIMPSEAELAHTELVDKELLSILAVNPCHLVSLHLECFEHAGLSIRNVHRFTEPTKIKVDAEINPTSKTKRPSQRTPMPEQVVRNFLEHVMHVPELEQAQESANTRAFVVDFYFFCLSQLKRFDRLPLPVRRPKALAKALKTNPELTVEASQRILLFSLTYNERLLSSMVKVHASQKLLELSAEQIELLHTRYKHVYLRIVRASQRHSAYHHHLPHMLERVATLTQYMNDHASLDLPPIDLSQMAAQRLAKRERTKSMPASSLREEAYVNNSSSSGLVQEEED